MPGEHRYVRHLAPPDPATDDDASRTPSPWRPADAWSPSWLRARRDELDVVHVHFGFEHLTQDEMAQWLETVAALGLRLVYTVHDIDNPNLRGQDHHHALVALLLAAADAVVTLTDGAAREVERRWRRRPEVIAHPHLVSSAWLAGQRIAPPRARPVVGVHVGALRANIDAVGALEAITTATAPYDVRVLARADALATAKDARLLAALTQLRRQGAQVNGRPPLPQHDLWRLLADLDVLVLPYRWATHSGWVEECHDLGVGVLASDCGYLTEQSPAVRTFGWADVDSGADITPLLDLALAGRVRADPEARRDQRLSIARRHADIYRSLT
ncbi:glycosyltransferase [Luteipulveratus flavus]|uniref:glycosyltransferase n=1 Tax=Luteipulveratus flavus TaxID=3031728 RepID=UPI003211E77C